MMGRFRVVLFCFILTEILIFRVMAGGSEGSERKDGPSPSRETLSEPEGGGGDRAAVAEPPEIRRLGKHHHSSDKSVAGGGVILGGLVTAVMASVFCYIRVTRRRHGGEPKLPAGGNGN